MDEEHIVQEKQIVRAVLVEVRRASDAVKENIALERDLLSRLGIIESWALKKIDIISAVGPHARRFDEKNNDLFGNYLNQDVLLEKTIAELVREITAAHPTISQWHTTSISDQMFISSSVGIIDDTLFDYARDVLLLRNGQSNVTTDEILSMILYDTEKFLEKLFSREVANIFIQLVDRWNRCAETERSAIIQDFKKFMFVDLISRWDPLGGQQQKVAWYTQYKGMDYKEPFVLARFFVLGYRDDMTLQLSTRIAIDAVAYAIKDWYHFSDAKKNDEHLTKPLFKAFVSNLCRMLLLRSMHHQNLMQKP